MPRSVVFIGNCQAETLSVLYRDVVADRVDDNVAYLASYRPADSEAAAVVRDADVVVRQVLDFAPQTDALTSGGRTVFMPLLSAPFLWPCSGRAHPLNAPIPYGEPSGPYDAELGDSFLDRMIARGTPTAEAVAVYLDTDVVALRHVDRMREITMERLRAREAACGDYKLADAIEAKLPSEKLFRTANHPERALTLLLASQVFERIGVPSSSMDGLAAYSGALFPPNEAPIHPTVARHYNLAYASEETRYRYFQEGAFTFVEFCRRYMDYEWDRDLPHGLYLAARGFLIQAELLLRRSVQTSPGSAVAHAVLSDVLVEQNRAAEALEFIRRAVDLEPYNAHYKSRYEYIFDLTNPK